MFDVFYSGPKPNLFAHELPANSIEHAQTLSRTRYFWWINYLSDYTGWDFLWEPVPWEEHQRHAWASQHQIDSGTYLVPRQGFADTHYHTQIITRLSSKDNWQVPGSIDTNSFDFSWHPDFREPPYIYRFGTQWQLTGGPEYHTPGAVDIKYTAFPRAEKTSIDPCWHFPTSGKFAEFDLTWHPDLRDPPYIYQFGTQHQKTGGPQYRVPGAVDTKFVDQIRVKAITVATAVYEIDHMDGNAGQIPNTTKISRYFDNYLDTLRRLAKNIPAEHEFVWICSSICDYTNFDFTWHPEQWQAGMLHVFASDGEKFGDTFFMHVPSFKTRADSCKLLEWYDVNFVETTVPRRPMPVITHNYDSQVDAVKNIEFQGPLAIFSNTDYVSGNLVTVPLWREKTKTIVPLSAGATSVVVPKSAISCVKTQLYDYPHIDRTQKMLKDELLDIVFISNGEPSTESTFNHLHNTVSNLFTANKIHRVDGVNGRVAAYHAAAEISTTPWFFAVFAKLFVNEKFDWSWQPDRMQQSKHYIFHALNPVNGLEYGHQAMIAYNKRLVLDNTGQGLDFTLDDAHEVVPILSGTALYNISPWVAWRTAFREVLKLQASLPDVENEYRLSQWLSTNPGSSQIVNEEWSRWVAEDAVEYYNEVNGDFDALKKSYEWSWLASYAFMKRSLTPTA